MPIHLSRKVLVHKHTGLIFYLSRTKTQSIQSLPQADHLTSKVVRRKGDAMTLLIPAWNHPPSTPRPGVDNKQVCQDPPGVIQSRVIGSSTSRRGALAWGAPHRGRTWNQTRETWVVALHWVPGSAEHTPGPEGIKKNMKLNTVLYQQAVNNIT